MRIRTAVYITLFVLAILMAVALTVFWNIYIIKDYLIIRDLQTALHGDAHHVPSAERWTVLALGIVFCVVLIVALSLFFASVMRSTRFKRQQRDFGNMMTHELRLPLSGIRVFAQTLQQRVLGPEEHARFVGGILSECDRLGLLIDQLLKIQQIEHHQLLLHRQTLDLGALVQDFAARWPRPIQWRLQASPKVNADPLLIEMALANLVSNAEKYGRESVPEIALSRDGRWARLSVRDGGRPIPRKYLKRIFRKFYRIPNLTTRRQNGVGLGLYVVKSIARLHHGSAMAQAHESPEGNEFSLRLPLDS